MLTEETLLDRIEIDETRTLFVRHATYFVRDGVRQPNPTYHRGSHLPHSDVSAADVLVQRIAAAAWLDVPKPVPQEMPIP